jgi:hypothetical protein
VKEKLQRFPSSIYWSGLGTLGFRFFDGSQAAYHRFLSARSREPGRYAFAGMDPRSKESDETEPVQKPRSWHQGIPQAPEAFLKEAALTLTCEEALYLRDRILETQPHSLLAAILREGAGVAEAEFPWQHPIAKKLTHDLRSVIDHARNFSEALHGAALLYNLMLAEATKNEEWIEKYRISLSEWAATLRGRWAEIVAWQGSLAALWSNPALIHARVQREKTFIQEWLTVVVAGAGPENLAQSELARSRIRDRERAMKSDQRARLINSDLLERWRGASGTAQLDFRWGTARELLNDIFMALEKKGGRDA